MSWTTFSSPSSKRGTRRCAKDKDDGGPSPYWRHRLAGSVLGLALSIGITGYALAAPVNANTDAAYQASAPAVAHQPEGWRFGILGSLAFKTPSHKFSERWTGVVERARKERALYAACAEKSARCADMVLRWRQMLDELRGLSKGEQIGALNARINDLLAYSDDGAAYNAGDHWASPLAFITTGKGDCEDFAILKFFSLLELGFANEQLRVAIVRDTRRKVMHAVTTVTLEGRVFVLDSLHRAAVQHHNIMKYAPVYSANLTGQWTHLVTRRIRVQFANATARRLAGRGDGRLAENIRSAPQRHDAGTPLNAGIHALKWMRSAGKDDALRAAWT